MTQADHRLHADNIAVAGEINLASGQSE